MYIQRSYGKRNQSLKRNKLDGLNIVVQKKALKDR